MRGIAIIIDKLTRSIEDARSGGRVETNVYRLEPENAAQVKISNWLFDWKWELVQPRREVFKLVTVADPSRIQGLVSLEDLGDHIFVHLIENAKTNRGPQKEFEGVAGNLFAFACRLSVSVGYNGIVAFDSKTRLIDHYVKKLGAKRLFGNRLMIDENIAKSLIIQYFGEK